MIGAPTALGTESQVLTKLVRTVLEASWDIPSRFQAFIVCRPPSRCISYSLSLRECGPWVGDVPG